MCASKTYVHNTPILKSFHINEISGAEVFFKCGNFQKLGAFKMRGAPNAILNPWRLSDFARDKCTQSRKDAKKIINVTLSAVEALLKIELN